MQEITYREAILAALQEEMRRDDKILIMGEDIGPSGGPFKTCQGLYEEFGAARVRDTPIAETGFVGAALGLAITGYRPIAEIMFADFLGVCFDQIVNSIAKHRFMSGGKVKAPLVIRAIGGAGLRFAAQHSQTGESWLLSVPGLTIVCPSSPNEAYGMLRAAIRYDNPVVVFEHKALLLDQGPGRHRRAGAAADRAEDAPRGARRHHRREPRDGRPLARGGGAAGEGRHRGGGLRHPLAPPDDHRADRREREEDQHPRRRRGAGAGRRLDRRARRAGDRGRRSTISTLRRRRVDAAGLPGALQPAARRFRDPVAGAHRRQR